MPLESAAVGTPGFSRNVEAEVKAGKPVAQAVAIAYSKSGEGKMDRMDAVLTAADGLYARSDAMARGDWTGVGDEDKKLTPNKASERYQTYYPAGEKAEAAALKKIQKAESC